MREIRALPRADNLTGMLDLRIRFSIPDLRVRFLSVGEVTARSCAFPAHAWMVIDGGGSYGGFDAGEENCRAVLVVAKNYARGLHPR